MSATAQEASPSAACPLEDSLTEQTRAHASESGLVALHDGRDSLAARVLLADASTRTLDVQYYIWRNDLSGNILFEALRRAADRGVCVRLLLDDNNTGGLDSVPAALALARLFHRFFAPEPAHAQQIVHRRCPSHHRRRAQYRRRILRCGQTSVVR
jgi:phosphatidylserine/phosphatidylglycerophosphate/cardiolipin synthase-like enzyme